MDYNKEYSLTDIFKKAGVVFCPTCKKGYTDKDNKIAIEKGLECLSCDHIRSDTMEDMTA